MAVSRPPSDKNPNRLLAALPPAQYERLAPKLERVSLSFKQTLYEPRVAITHVYFPHGCVVSLLTVMQDGASVEVATVGNEGMVCLPVLLGAESALGRAIVQVPGGAERMKADTFRNELKENGPLLAVLHRYTQALFNQIAQSAACNRLHSVEKRCSRWLLLTHDRVPSDDFPLTQEFLANMLGVRRASVTQAAGMLQKAGLIAYTRGRVRILDRDGLEAMACECYGVVRQEFERLVGTSGR